MNKKYYIKIKIQMNLNKLHNLLQINKLKCKNRCIQNIKCNNKRNKKRINNFKENNNNQKKIMFKQKIVKQNNNIMINLVNY